jgi:hypothetical protein
VVMQKAARRVFPREMKLSLSAPLLVFATSL